METARKFRATSPMNYYEELDLASSASTEEIRQAYRTLAGLIHPDRQQQPAAQKIAECQMRRLNRILATLEDPVLRKKYDAGLRAKPQVVKVITRSVVDPVTTRMVWLAAVLVGLSLLWVTLREGIARPTGSKADGGMKASGSCTEALGLEERILSMEKQLEAIRLTQRSTKKGEGSRSTDATR
ncbi:MAG TPA: DnaJ domain-containing protein [Bryobacteraceae bacterium]|nr:DnaJ domain-containing protein [Bryobacteraceae bacterium]